MYYIEHFTEIQSFSIGCKRATLLCFYSFFHYRRLKNPIVNIQDARIVSFLPETRLPGWFMLRYFQKYLHSHAHITINQWNAIILYIYMYIEVTIFKLRKREWLAFSNQGIFTWYANRAHITCLLTMQMTRSKASKKKEWKEKSNW